MGRRGGAMRRTMMQLGPGVILGVALVLALQWLSAVVRVATLPSLGTSDDAFEAGHNTALEELLSRDWRSVDRLLVIPGGGPGSQEDAGYPPWTQQRTEEAVRTWDGEIVLESVAIADHLMRAGIPAESIVCDFISWDTVANAWVTRLVADAIASMRSSRTDLGGGQRHRRGGSLAQLKPLRVQVFISDFHAGRVQAAMDWVFSLPPTSLERQHPLRPQHGGGGGQSGVVIEVISVASFGLDWGNDPLAFKKRMEHEETWQAKLKKWKNDGLLRDMADLQSYLFLGGHQGYFGFTHGSYKRTEGAGWGADGGGERLDSGASEEGGEEE